jgi:hypothetical protein
MGDLRHSRRRGSLLQGSLFKAPSYLPGSLVRAALRAPPAGAAHHVWRSSQRVPEATLAVGEVFAPRPHGPTGHRQTANLV